MLYKGIYINCDKLIEIAYNLKQKNIKIEECYNSIVEKLVDGSTENWQCKSQEDYYKAMESLTDKYTKNVGKLTEIYNFLCKVISDYEQREETADKFINENADNFDM